MNICTQISYKTFVNIGTDIENCFLYYISVARKPPIRRGRVVSNYIARCFNRHYCNCFVQYIGIENYPHKKVMRLISTRGHDRYFSHQTTQHILGIIPPGTLCLHTGNISAAEILLKVGVIFPCVPFLKQKTCQCSPVVLTGVIGFLRYFQKILLVMIHAFTDSYALYPL